MTTIDKQGKVFRVQSRIARLVLTAVAMLMAMSVLGAGTAAAARTDGMQSYKGIDPEQWLRDVDTALSTASADLRGRVAQGGKLAIVFDIDDTTLATDFAIDRDNIPAVDGSLKLAKEADQSGVEVFYITNRNYASTNSPSKTRIALERAGLPVHTIYHRTPGDSRGKQEMKTAYRAQIEDDGYTIIQNVGNNWTDLNGGHAERTYKLPDYDGKLQ
ncbi:HAD family acid phosphatase [Nocardia sp. NPDC060256]|uniref:HAD family acid phosphatase n=1 Tax=unclassified Nocardia TaxID=2637762 RepID=UPI0036685CCD